MGMVDVLYYVFVSFYVIDKAMGSRKPPFNTQSALVIFSFAKPADVELSSYAIYRIEMIFVRFPRRAWEYPVKRAGPFSCLQIQHSPVHAIPSRGNEVKCLVPAANRVNICQVGQHSCIDLIEARIRV